MASIANVITTTFRAHGSQAIAQMGTVAQSFGRVGSVINNNTRLSEKLNNQWKAIATTIRYAIAGQAVYGLYQMTQQLNQLQQQIGLISALGGMPSQQVVQGLGDIRTAAIQSVTPISDFNEGIINLYSSVQNPPPINAAAEIIKEISLTAQLAQTDVPNASKAITGMLNIFNQPANIENVRKYTRAIQDIILTVPGGKEAGAQIMQQFPIIASQLVAHGGTAPQGLAMFQTLLRAGGTPATWGRGLSFMLQTIGNLGQQPKDVQRAFRSIGVTPDFVAQRGITAAVLRAMVAVRTRGGVRTTRRTRALSDDQLDVLAEDIGEGAEAGRNLGISGGGAELAGAMFHRVHALRAFSLLASRQDQFEGDINTMTDDFNGTAAAVKRNRQNVERFLDPQTLRRAQIAAESISQQVQLALAPVANAAATLLVGSNADPRAKPGGLAGLMNRHQEATQNIVRGGAAGIAALAIGRLLGAGKLPFVGRLFGGGIAGRTAVMGAAVEAMASGDQTRGASPLKPLFVVVVGPTLFGGGGGGIPGVPGSGGGGPGVPDPVETYFGYKIARAGLSKLRGVRGIGERGITKFGMRLGMFGAERGPWALKAARGVPGIGAAAVVADALINAENAGNNLYSDRQALQRAGISGAKNVTDVANVKYGKLGGRAEVFMTISINQNGKIVKRRVHVPLNVWATGPSPSSRGQGSHRGG